MPDHAIGRDHPWPDHRLPFTAFNRLFSWAYPYDTDAEDEAWLNNRDTLTMHGFAQQLLAMARAAVSRLDWDDPLLRLEVARVRSGDHPYRYLERRVAIERGRATARGVYK